jgi:hypothetical protein
MFRGHREGLELEQKALFLDGLGRNVAMLLL